MKSKIILEALRSPLGLPLSNAVLITYYALPFKFTVLSTKRTPSGGNPC